MAQAKTTKYLVGDKSYLRKEGKVFKSGEEISLTAQELENVRDLVTTLDGKKVEAPKEEKQDGQGEPKGE